MSRLSKVQRNLKRCPRNQSSARLRDRVRALYLCKTRQVRTGRELAAMLGCNESTIYRWFCTYQNLGMFGLLQLKTPPGKPSKLPADVLEGLQVRLAQRQGFRSYYEIQEWLATEYGVKAAYATVHGIVRYKLKSKLKSPRPVSIEAEPQLQDQFKKNCPN